MNSDAAPVITSRDNPLIKELRRLSHEPSAYRKLGRFWVEGDHLCRAALQRGVRPQVGIFSESFWGSSGAQWAHGATKNVVISDEIFRDVSGLESVVGLGFLLQVPERTVVLPDRATVILDRLQDAGNIGSVLRSAAAFGFDQVIAIKGCAALFSPKVIRAGMGAHFGLSLVEGADIDTLKDLGVPLLITSSHEGEWLHALTAQRQLPTPCAWVLGHEGQGVSAALAAQASLWVRIAQPGGEESLNVAAAAAICLHASAVAAMG